MFAKIAKSAKNHAWESVGVNGMGIEATCTVKIKQGAAEQRSSVRRELSYHHRLRIVFDDLVRAGQRRPFRPALKRGDSQPRSRTLRTDLRPSGLRVGSWR
jgi:hypothetical protein